MLALMCQVQYIDFFFVEGINNLTNIEQVSVNTQ